MKFSLVTGTYGRATELQRLFSSLAAQTYKDFELILVDQNEDDRVERQVDDWKARLPIVYLRSPKGLSRARNVGLAQCSGEIVAFPDDDCWYDPGLLQRVVDRFKATPGLGGLTGMSIDEVGRPSQGRWGTKAGQIDRANIWTSATSYTIFLSAAAARAAGRFNESLGVGSGTRWGAGEEVDFLLRILRQGHTLLYDPGIAVHHPNPTDEIDERTLRRSRLYNRGFGRVLGINAYPITSVLYLSGRAFARAAVCTMRLDLPGAQYAWIAGSQRLLGWLDRGDDHP